MMLVSTLLPIFLAAPSFQKELLQLGLEVTDLDFNPCKGKDVLSCTLADVDLSAFDDEILLLPGGVEVNKKNDIPESRTSLRDLAKSVAYAGQGCEAVFSLRDGSVIGNVEYKNGSDFVLEPCRNFQGCHVWKEEDTANMVDGNRKEIPEEFEEMGADDQLWKGKRADGRMSARVKNKFIQKGKDDDTTIVEYSVKFYYTKQFADATDDIELWFHGLVAETNQGYINSNIPVRVKNFCIEATQLNDKENTDNMFEEFRKYKGTAEALRGSADAAALLLHSTEYCGMGFTDSWADGNTITIQKKGCALGYFTMGHELAHNFGSLHNREESPTNRYYSHGHGSYIGPRYRTILAYPDGYRDRVNYYSSPTVFYEGIATGSDTEDTARVLKENRFGFAAVGDESGTCSAPAPTSEPSGCQDYDDWCPEWERDGYCQGQWSDYMSKNCAKSCNSC